jgi:pimeloyl-ACP methyl ester carboxylesterase
VIVLVHGTGLSRKAWLPQIESLSDSFRTVAPDLPGHGERADEPFRFEEAVRTVEAVVREADGNCVVLVGPVGIAGIGAGLLATAACVVHDRYVAAERVTSGDPLSRW